MFVAKYDDAENSDLDLGNGLYIIIVALFIYLGSMVSRDCSYEGDVQMSITASGGPIFAARSISMKVKKSGYISLVLTILLYGSECWRNCTTVFVPFISVVYGVCSQLIVCILAEIKYRMSIF